jgi:hypothetical protein
MSKRPGQTLDLAKIALFELEHDGENYFVASDAMTRTTEWILRYWPASILPKQGDGGTAHDWNHKLGCLICREHWVIISTPTKRAHFPSCGRRTPSLSTIRKSADSQIG